jgi:D-alanyl-D-alanine carboxypeptidase
MNTPRAVLAFGLALAASSVACSASSPSPTPAATLPAAKLQSITQELVTRSGAPGAIVGVVHGNERWLGVAGRDAPSGGKPLRTDQVVRVASISKMFTAALTMKYVAAGKVRLDDHLARYVPSFPNADAITIDQLLSHTAGVTTSWFDGPPLQGVVTADLGHVYAPDEVVSLLAKEPPVGPPGSGMHYSNADYVLLGVVASAVGGDEIGRLLQREVFDLVPLAHTTYGFVNPPSLLRGWYEYQGLVLDMSTLPQASLLSFAGPAGAVHSTIDDLLSFADALFRKRSVVGADGLARMMTPAEPGSYYGHGLMRFCPCADGVGGNQFTGWGHAGNLPGYWSELVYYPELDLIVAAAIDRDVIDGVALDHAVFDPTLRSIVDAVGATP